MPELVSGVRLSELYDRGAMKPLVEALCPLPAYAAALIGGGSEVLCLCAQQRTARGCRCTADPSTAPCAPPWCLNWGNMPHSSRRT